MKSIRVAISGHVYTVHIGSGLLAQSGELLRRVNKSHKLALVTDEEVGQRYGLQASTAFATHEYDVVELGIPAGEATKRLYTVEQLVESYAAQEVGRKDIVVALGGGVVGDIAGFTSAIYLRGIAFAQIPTTLLAMVDSSVGGKTGVNLEAAKNLVGSFKQPEAVIADVDLLKTMPDAEWKSGFAEIAKSALIDSLSFWGWIQKNAPALAAHDDEAVIEAISRCVTFKAGVVASDETEQGPRESLNYGHTLGHAIEKLAGYGTLTHGEAVAEGMRFASRLAVEALGAPVGLVQAQDAVLDTLGLPPLAWTAYPAEILAAMKSDKKSRSGRIRFVLPTAPGQWECVIVDDELIMSHLEAWCQSKKMMGVEQTSPATSAEGIPLSEEATLSEEGV